MTAWVLLSALATLVLLELAKNVVPWQIQSWFKTALAIAVAVATVLILEHRISIRGSVEGLAAAGASCLLNEVRSVLSMLSDNIKVEVISKSRRPPRR